MSAANEDVVAIYIPIRLSCNSSLIMSTSDRIATVVVGASDSVNFFLFIFLFIHSQFDTFLQHDGTSSVKPRDEGRRPAHCFH